MRRIQSSLSLLLAAALLCGGAALAQDRGAPRESVTSSDEDVLWSRGKDVLHTGNPHDLRGLEQGDNSFRERTPALEKSDRRVAYVDLDEVRARKLAMYESGKSFSTPLAAAAPPVPVSDFDCTPRDGASAPPDTAAPEDESVEPEGGHLGLILGLAGLVTVLVGLGWRRLTA